MLTNTFFRDNLFDDFFDDFMAPSRSLARMVPPQSAIMKTDIRESEDGYELDIDLPGFKKEDVKAELKDGYLTVSAASKAEEEGSGMAYVRRERFFGSCNRSFYVGDKLTREDIKARFEDGVLKLSVPKKKELPQVEVPRYISIE